MVTSRVRLRRTAFFVVLLLVIEFLDEFVFGAKEAAWPVIRTDLHLTYEQVGLLLSVPGLFAALIEPALGILGDVWKRHLLVLAGGVLFTGALLLTATSGSFLALLIATMLFFPASGAFVGLSQSTLMDIDPNRHEQNMARWTFAGSIGVVAGSSALGAAIALNGSWRGLFVGAAALSLILVVLARRFPHSAAQTDPGAADIRASFITGLINAWRAIRRREVLRWLVLLEFSDLLLDVLYSFLALYFVDVVGVSAEQTALVVAAWTVISLVGDLLIIPLLERVQGLRYLWLSAAAETILFPAFLLIPGWIPKLICLGLVGLGTSGWYSVLKGKLYSAMPGQSGTVFTVDSLFSLVHSFVPLGIGLVAERYGLGVAIWLLWLGPLALLTGLPSRKSGQDQSLPTS